MELVFYYLGSMFIYVAVILDIKELVVTSLGIRTTKFFTMPLHVLESQKKVADKKDYQFPPDEKARDRKASKNSSTADSRKGSDKDSMI